MGLDTDLALALVALFLLLSRLSALAGFADSRARMSLGPFDQIPVLRKVGWALIMATLWATAAVAFVFRWQEWAPWYWALPVAVVFYPLVNRWHAGHTKRLVEELRQQTQAD